MSSQTASPNGSALVGAIHRAFAKLNGVIAQALKRRMLARALRKLGHNVDRASRDGALSNGSGLLRTP